MSSEHTPNTDTGTFKVGQRVLMRTRRGMWEGIIRDFGADTQGNEVVFIDHDPMRGAPLGAFMGQVYDVRLIVGPVVRKP